MESSSDTADAIRDLARSIDTLTSKVAAVEKASRRQRDRIGQLEEAANFKQNSQLVIETGRSAIKANDRAEDASRAASHAASTASGLADKVNTLTVDTGKQLKTLSRAVDKTSYATKTTREAVNVAIGHVEEIGRHATQMSLVATKSGEAISQLVDADAEHAAVLETVTEAIKDLGKASARHSTQLGELADAVKRAASQSGHAVEAHTAVKSLALQVTQLQNDLNGFSQQVAAEASQTRRDRTASDERLENIAANVDNLASHVSLLREIASPGAIESSPTPAVDAS